METLLRIALLLYYVQPAIFALHDCVIDLECPECLPDNMPLVTSHRAANGSVAVRAGDEVALSCGAGRLAAYPLRSSLVAACEAGRYRVPLDRRLRHLLELGCQENVFEDVLHSVEDCASPLQGRAYRTSEPDGARHLATVCFDADRGVAVRARAAAPGGALALAPHAERAAPLSLLGNFNHMFDAATRAAAARLYSDDARTNRRLHEIVKHEHVSFAGQTLTAARLLSPHYFDDQDMRVTDFVSNKVAAWRSVAEGNLRHVQLDVARLLRGARALHVHAGTHGVAALRTEPAAGVEIFLKGERFPVPEYVWTVVHEPGSRRALAVVVHNDPFVAVSEVRAAVLCPSACSRVSWLAEARRQRRYETPLYGLTFCCGVHEAAALLPEIPRRAFADVPPGDTGVLAD